jgi:hypothetical protein
MIGKTRLALLRHTWFSERPVSQTDPSGMESESRVNAFLPTIKCRTPNVRDPELVDRHMAARQTPERVEQRSLLRPGQMRASSFTPDSGLDSEPGARKKK